MPKPSYIHRETYRQPDDARLDEHGITSLAQFYTSDLKYAPARCEATSRKLYRLLRDKGFTDKLIAEMAVAPS
jgi:hypothetical protein